MPSKIIKSDFNGLNQLVKTLGDGQVVRVGILAKKAGRYEAGKVSKLGGHKVSKEKSPLTNAELGAIHEFGSLSRNIPKRSFLRMPIFQEAANIVKKAAEFIPQAVEKGNMTIVLKAIGHECEAVIQRAFGSGGFGRWKKDSNATIARKKSSSPLIDTAQLRRSIASEVGKSR